MLGKKLLICVAGAVFALSTIPVVSQASVHYTGTALSTRLSHANLTTSAKHTKLAKSKGKKGKGGKHHKHKGKKGSKGKKKA